MDIFWNHTINMIDVIAGIQMLRSAYIVTLTFLIKDYPQLDPQRNLHLNESELLVTRLLKNWQKRSNSTVLLLLLTQ